jgi:hypothetical protein
MFRALLAHPQEAPANRMAFGILRAYVSSLWHDCGETATLYSRNIPNAVCSAPPEDKRVKLETCRDP